MNPLTQEEAESLAKALNAAKISKFNVIASNGSRAWAAEWVSAAYPPDHVTRPEYLEGAFLRALAALGKAPEVSFVGGKTWWLTWTPESGTVCRNATNLLDLLTYALIQIGMEMK